jgi:general secretion pathway protein D
MVFLRPVVVRSKEQNNSLATDRYDYMRASRARPAASTTCRQGAPVLPPPMASRQGGSRCCRRLQDGRRARRPDRQAACRRRPFPTKVPAPKPPGDAPNQK